MHIPHAIRTSPGSLRGLTRPCKGALRPDTLGFYVQRRREMAPPRKRRERHFPSEEMALTAMATVHIVAGVLRPNVHHLNPCVDQQNPSQLPCRRPTLETCLAAALLL